jgi:hypothetical protein
MAHPLRDAEAEFWRSREGVKQLLASTQETTTTTATTTDVCRIYLLVMKMEKYYEYCVEPTNTPHLCMVDLVDLNKKHP